MRPCKWGHAPWHSAADNQLLFYSAFPLSLLPPPLMSVRRRPRFLLSAIANCRFVLCVLELPTDCTD